MVKEMNNYVNASILICRYFNSEDALSRYRRLSLKKIKDNNNHIDFTIVLDLVQEIVENRNCSLILVKFTDNTYNEYSGFKIIAEVSLNPKINMEEFKDSLCGELEHIDFEKLISQGKSINQTFAFARKDEEMQGLGYYSVIFSDKSVEELKREPNRILDNIIDECRFEVV